MNIEFIYEVENEGKLSFLDVHLIRKGNDICTTVYRKATNNDVYLNWYAFAPNTWKRGTLKTFIERAYLICSTEELRIVELKYIEKVFYKVNNYPKYVIKQVLKQVHEEHNKTAISIVNNIVSTINNEPPITEKHPLLVLPYQGQKGDRILKSFQKEMNKLLPDNIKPKIAFTGKKLGTSFQVKDKTEKKHNHDVIYYGKCPEDQCTEDYLGETGRRFNERVTDHAGRDTKSYLYKHSMETGHRSPNIDEYVFKGSGFRSIFKRRIAEAILIKELKPSLNKQEQSIELKLF